MHETKLEAQHVRAAQRVRNDDESPAADAARRRWCCRRSSSISRRSPASFCCRARSSCTAHASGRAHTLNVAIRMRAWTATMRAPVRLVSLELRPNPIRILNRVDECLVSYEKRNVRG